MQMFAGIVFPYDVYELLHPHRWIRSNWNYGKRNQTTKSLNGESRQAAVSTKPRL